MRNVSKTVQPLSADPTSFSAGVVALVVGGGGDLREHVYAGIDTGLNEQPWRPGASHHIILTGDAPPLDDYKNGPRNYDSIIAASSSHNRQVAIHSIGIKSDLLCQALIGDGL